MGAYDDIYSDLMAGVANASMAMGRGINNSNTNINQGLEDSLKYLGEAFDQGNAFLTPYRVAGQSGLKPLQNIVGVNGQQAQYQAISSIMKPSLDAMASYGQDTTNKAMAGFLNAVAPGYVDLIAGSGSNPSTLKYNQDMGGLTKQIIDNPAVQSMMSYLQDQGSRSVQNSAAAQGMLRSGRTLNQLQENGQAIATQNVLPMVNNLVNNVVQGISGIQQTGQQQTAQAGASLAASSLSSVQNSLLGLVQQGNQASMAAAEMAAKRGLAGSDFTYRAGEYKANNSLLAGKVEQDALNAISMLQWQQDMGPYANALAAPPGAAGGPGGGGGGSAGMSFPGGAQSAASYNANQPFFNGLQANANLMQSFNAQHMPASMQGGKK